MKIDENSKVTFGQLKRLVKESYDEMEAYTVRNTMFTFSNSNQPKEYGTYRTEEDAEKMRHWLARKDPSWRLENTEVVSKELNPMLPVHWTNVDDLEEIAVKNLRDYAANKIISGDTEQEFELSGGGQGIREFDAILKKVGYSKVCVLGDRINFKHGSPMEDTLVKNRSGKYAVASLEQKQGKPAKMQLWIVNVEPIREYAEILDTDNLDESLKIKKELTMKNINENEKVTLTIGQLKKLVKESVGSGVKDFEDVKVGDIAHRDGYDTSLFVVINKGTARKLAKFDTYGGLTDGLNDGYIDDNDPCVVVQSLENGVVSVWTYGDGGIIVKWEMGNIKNITHL